MCESAVIFANISSVATAIGVAVAAWQLWLTRRQGKTTFEDTFAREYRELAATLPTKALLGETLTNEEYCEAFDEFYHYSDLCNTQVFLHQEGRISKKTWKYWRDGMETNLNRPGFERAWSEIAARANGDFGELRKEFPPKPMYISKSMLRQAQHERKCLIYRGPFSLSLPKGKFFRCTRMVNMKA